MYNPHPPLSLAILKVKRGMHMKVDFHFENTPCVSQAGDPQAILPRLSRPETACISASPKRSQGRAFENDYERLA